MEARTSRAMVAHAANVAGRSTIRAVPRAAMVRRSDENSRSGRLKAHRVRPDPEAVKALAGYRMFATMPKSICKGFSF